MKQSGNLPSEQALDQENLIELLEEKVRKVDWEQAKLDIKAFISDPKVLDIWSEPFFLDLITHLKTT